jgi:hypothetical protein
LLASLAACPTRGLSRPRLRRRNGQRVPHGSYPSHTWLPLSMHLLLLPEDVVAALDCPRSS